MSGLLNKVKEVVSGHDSKTSHHDTSTTGSTHTSGATYDTLGNVGAGGYPSSHSTTGGNVAHGTGTSTNYGPHDSNVGNKLDPRVDSDRDGSRTSGNTTGAVGTSTNYGPHNSNIGNKLDPRVDSDYDNSRTTGGYGTSNTTGSHGTSTNYGPHDSNVGNKLDPRVDSDRDGLRTAGNTTGGNYGSGTTGGTFGHRETGTGITPTHGSGDNYSSGTTGGQTTGHNSSLLNKLDPRVDSDRDGSRTVGGQTGTGITGTGTGTSSHGHHQTGLLADKLVDADHRTASGHETSYAAGGVHHGNHGMSSNFDDYTSTGQGHHHGHHGTGVGSTTGTGIGALGSSGHNSSTTGTGYGTTGTGHDSTNYGPHSSNAANKLDPRVDSDRDGSHTSGGYGNTTHTSYGTGAANYDNSPNTSTGSGTVQPHKSSLLNKLDPRVDETQTHNTTGSGVGQNIPPVHHQGQQAGGIFSSGRNEGNYNDRDVTQSGVGGRDSRDAAQVPPSQFQGSVTGNSKSGNAF